ncbi:MAG TPA: chaperone modulator CbpM [Candidatus Methylomirabilis sp.]
MAWDDAEIQIHIAAIVEDETDDLTPDDLALRCGLRPTALEAYTRVGVVQFNASTGRFPFLAVGRLRKAIRLRRDLGVDLVAVGIVLDLVGRLEAMEAEIERLRAELSRAPEASENEQFPIGE